MDLDSLHCTRVVSVEMRNGTTSKKKKEEEEEDRLEMCLGGNELDIGSEAQVGFRHHNGMACGDIH